MTGTDDRLLSDGVHTDTYDKKNNRTSKTVDATDERTDYVWNQGGQLPTVTLKDAQGAVVGVITYRYDALGRRFGKDIEVGGNGTADPAERCVFDGTGGVGHVDDVMLQFDKIEELRNRYFHGPGVNQIIAEESLSVSTQGSGGDPDTYTVDEMLWAMADHQGTVHDWVTRAGNNSKSTLRDHVDYDSFGGVVDQSSTTREVTYGYTGRFHDADAGLIDYRARWYDPNVGRFVSGDPIGFAGGDANLAAYVENAVLFREDATGLDWLDTSANFFAGWGDTLTFGGTDVVRGRLGINDGVDHSSTAYVAGVGVGVVHSTVFGDAAGAAKGGVKAADKEYSHWIPARTMRKWLPTRLHNARPLANGNYVTASKHALSEPYR